MSTIGPADRLEIHELIARYNRAVDGGDPDSWVATFTEDGVFQSLLVGNFSGRDELAEFAKRFAIDREYRTWTGGQHWISNVIIDPGPEPDEFIVFSYHIMYVPRDSEVRGVLMAAHNDIVRRTTDGWKFAVRRLIPWPPGSDRNVWKPDTGESSK